MASKSSGPLPPSIQYPQFYSRLSDKNKTRFTQLTELYAKGTRARTPILDLIQKVASCIKELWRQSPLYALSKDYNLLLMAHEGLSHAGSFNFIHKQLFLKLIKDRNGPHYDDLRQGIKNMETLESTVVKGVTPLGREELARKMQNKFESLKPGESMWIDLSSRPGKHAMKGRIACDHEGFCIFQMSNTGAGIESNQDLHKAQVYKGKPRCQTVVEWGPFAKNELGKDFFHDIINATILGKAPQDYIPKTASKEKATGTFGEAIEPIQAIYYAVRKHFESKIPLKDIRIDSPYWSREQQGPSCVPNSFWGLARVVLSAEEYKNARMDIRIRNLQRNYQKIVSGWDRSDYTKIKALEQVQKLIKSLEKSNQQVPAVLQRIAKDVEDRIPETRRCVKLKNHNKFHLTEEMKEIVVRVPKFISIPGSLKAHVEFTVEKMADGSNLTLPVTRDAEGKPEGVTTLGHLVYEAILNDDDTAIQNSLTPFLSLLNTSAPGKLPCNRDELAILIRLFLILAEQLREIDRTIEGRAKQMAIVNIAQSLYTVYFAHSLQVTNELGTVDQTAEELGQIMQREMKSATDFYSEIGVGGYRDQKKGIWLGDAVYDFRPWEFKSEWIPVHTQQTLITVHPQKRIVTPAVGIHIDEKSEKFHLQLYVFAPSDKTPQSPINAKRSKIGKKNILSAGANTVAGKSYLFYYYLATGQDAKAKTTVDELIKSLHKKDTSLEMGEAAALQEVISLLSQFSEDMRKLDTSAESLLWQHITSLLAKSLLNVLKTNDPGNTEVPRMEKKLNDLLQYYTALQPILFIQKPVLRKVYDEAKKL